MKRTEDRLKEYRDLVEIAKDIRKDIIDKLDQCSRHRQLFSEIASRRDQHFLSSQYFSGIESRFEGRLSEEQLEALRELHGGEHSAFRNALREAIRDATNNLSSPIKSHIERLDAEKEELKSQREELRSYRAGLEQEERNLEKILVKEYGTDADKRSYEIVTGKIDTLRAQMESLYKDLFDEKITKEEFDRKKEEIVARLQELGREKASVVAQAVKNFWNEVRDTRQAFINERDRLRESLYQGYFAKVLDELKNKEQVARKEFLNETSFIQELTKASAQEVLRDNLKHRAAFETWDNMTDEEKQLYISSLKVGEERQKPETSRVEMAEEKRKDTGYFLENFERLMLEKGIDRAGNWHPADERLYYDETRQYLRDVVRYGKERADYYKALRDFANGKVSQQLVWERGYRLGLSDARINHDIAVTKGLYEETGLLYTMRYGIGTTAEVKILQARMRGDVKGIFKWYILNPEAGSRALKGLVRDRLLEKFGVDKKGVSEYKAFLNGGLQRVYELRAIKALENREYGKAVYNSFMAFVMSGRSEKFDLVLESALRGIAYHTARGLSKVIGGMMEKAIDGIANMLSPKEDHRGEKEEKKEPSREKELKELKEELKEKQEVGIDRKLGMSLGDRTQSDGNLRGVMETYEKIRDAIIFKLDEDIRKLAGFEVTERDIKEVRETQAVDISEEKQHEERQQEQALKEEEPGKTQEESLQQDSHLEESQQKEQEMALQME